MISIICFALAVVLALCLPFIRQAGEDAALNELKKRGVLK
jgi:hypothetical protein